MFSENGSVAAAPRKVHKRQRRKLDRATTLARYAARVRELPEHTFAALENAYLSTFDIYNTVTPEVALSGALPDCSAFHLLRVARERGVNVLGVTSERRSRGEFMCRELLDGKPRHESRVVYTGPYNYFTQHAHSVWSVQPADKAYYDSAPATAPPPPAPLPPAGVPPS